MLVTQRLNSFAFGRSREGAWIEIYCSRSGWHYQGRRSREGAWIEIPLQCGHVPPTCCRSREGAWIEISAPAGLQLAAPVAPARERGLKLLEQSSQHI